MDVGLSLMLTCQPFDLSHAQFGACTVPVRRKKVRAARSPSARRSFDFKPFGRFGINAGRRHGGDAQPVVGMPLSGGTGGSSAEGLQRFQQ
eukprot:849117-Alexandrium_andersonii.AAC.1